MPAAMLDAVTTLIVVANACASLIGNVVWSLVEKSCRVPPAGSTANDMARTSGLESLLMLESAFANLTVAGYFPGAGIEAPGEPGGERAIRDARHDVEDLELGLRADTLGMSAARQRPVLAGCVSRLHLQNAVHDRGDVGRLGLARPLEIGQAEPDEHHGDQQHEAERDEQAASEHGISADYLTPTVFGGEPGFGGSEV